MSISLALLPVSLVMRAVMGKDKFNHWVNSSQLRIPTCFSDELDIARTLKKAGYDAEKWGVSIKTHIRGEKEFFFWDLIEGKWTAVFSKYDSEEMLKSFISDLEGKSGRKLFLRDLIKEKNKPQSNIFPTNFKDKDLLIKTLMEFGGNLINESNDMITYSYSNIVLKFISTDNGLFGVEINNEIEMGNIFKTLSLIDKEYKQNVQKYAYMNLKEKVANKGLTIENEEVLDDNSILITIQI